MNVKLLLVTVAVVVVIADIVGADFGFQHYPPKEEDLKSLGLECFPRRTVIKLEEAKEGLKNEDSGEDTVDDGETRRSHMNAGQNSSEKCKVCVCSVDGKMEYCSRRPARNINECIRMAMLTEKLQKNIPYRHEDTLAFRIRRVGDINADKCVPFVSGYSDCTEDNKCGGCTTCSCNARAEWECKKVFQCPIDEGDEDEMSDENNFTYTMDVLHSEVKKQHEMQKAKKRFVPLPPSHSSEDALIGYIIAIPRRKH